MEEVRRKLKGKEISALGKLGGVNEGEMTEVKEQNKRTGLK
jgi:hypothetical protein